MDIHGLGMIVIKHFRFRLRQLVSFYIAIGVVTLPFAVGAQNLAFAVGENCDYVYAEANNIETHDDCFQVKNTSTSACSVGGVGNIGDSADNAEAIFKYLISTNFSTLGNKPLNATQAAAFLGNFYQESRYDPVTIQSGKAFNSQMAMNKDLGGYGFGLVQWDSSRRVDLLNFANSKKASWESLSLQLEFIKHELEGTEQRIMNDSVFKTTTSVDDATLRVRILYERPGDPHDDIRKAEANKIYAQFVDLAPGIVDSSGNCTVQGGTGDIAAVAVSLSWSQRAEDGATDHTALQNKPEYTEALVETGVNKLGDSCSMGGNSCDAFIATVIRLSGFDPNFPCCGTASQKKYLDDNPGKYEKVATQVLDYDILQPGDILWRDGHVKIYIGNNREAAASHCKRTGEQSVLYLEPKNVNGKVIGVYDAYRPKDK